MIDMDALKEHFDCIDEFIRRGEKRFPNGDPMPYDRWLDGNQGTAKLHAALKVQKHVVAILLAEIAERDRAMKAAGFESMEPHRDPMR